MNKEMHLKSDIDRFYVSRMEGGRALIGCKMCMKAEEKTVLDDMSNITFNL